MPIDANETIVGNYFTMPDGQVMQKMTDGKWISVADRVAEQVKSIDDMFNDTTTIPTPWEPPSSPNVFHKPTSGNGRNIEDLITVSTTHKHLHAHLIEILGSPTEIIRQGKLHETISKKTVNDYHVRRSAEQIIKALNCEPWNSVLKIMTNS
jgi:hypothetical protein